MVALAALTAQSALAGGASESAAVLQERAVAVQPLETVTGDGRHDFGCDR